MLYKCYLRCLVASVVYIMVDEVIVDYRKRKTDLQPICINRECVEGVSCFKFQDVHMDADLQWSSNTVPSLQDLYSTAVSGGHAAS